MSEPNPHERLVEELMSKRAERRDPGGAFYAVANGLHGIAEGLWGVFVEHPAPTIVALMAIGAVGFAAPPFWIALLILMTLWVAGTLAQRHRIRAALRDPGPSRERQLPGGVRVLEDGTYLWPDGQILDQFEHVERREREAALLPPDLRDPAWAEAREAWHKRVLLERDQYAAILDFARRTWYDIGRRSLTSEQAVQLLGKDEAARRHAYAVDAVARAERMHPEGIRLGILRHQDQYGDLNYGDTTVPRRPRPTLKTKTPVMPRDEVLIVPRGFRVTTDCGAGHSGEHHVLPPELGDAGIRRQCKYCPSTWIEGTDA